MSAREDSVLTSLNELRRLKNERRKHGAGRKNGRRAHDRESGVRHLPASDVTPPPRAMPATGFAQPQFQPAPLPSAPVPNAAAWSVPPEPAVVGQMMRPKSSAKPAIIVAVVLLAAGAAGYAKLDADWQAQLRAKEAAVRSADDTRIQAVEAAVKAERQAQNQLKACEAKLHTVPSSTGAAAVVTPSVTPSAASVYPPPGATSRCRRGRSHAAARPARPRRLLPRRACARRTRGRAR